MFLDPFDFNGDGVVDAGESALEYMIFCEVFGEDEEKDHQSQEVKF